VLRADSLAYLGAGLVLLASPWDPVWEALDLPQVRPELWTQLAGALLVAFAYLLWIAPRAEGLARATAATACLANALVALILAAWLVSGDLDTGALGTVLLSLTAAACAAFALAEGYIASRRLAPLLPLD
jgi:hypothetical protein